MKGRGFFGRCNILISTTGVLIVLLWAAHARAQSADFERVHHSNGVSVVTINALPSQDRDLSGAVFTAVSPIAVPRDALNLRGQPESASAAQPGLLPRESRSLRQRLTTLLRLNEKPPSQKSNKNKAEPG